MSKRYEYYLDMSKSNLFRSAAGAPQLFMRPAHPADIKALAELMLEAYRGTIDYDGETIEDCISEVQAYLAGQRGGQPLLAESRLYFDGDTLVSACLVGEWDDRRQPIVAYVMTRPEWKGRGLAKQVIKAALTALIEKGYTAVRAVITAGNTPSERVFSGLGFQRVDFVD